MLYTDGMHKTKSGFTLIELLIVLVVIGILVGITLVTYRGTQGRARDTERYDDVQIIMKALALYYADNNTYPPTSASPSANGCTTSSYSYSWATDGTWMKPLIDGGYLKKIPLPPDNSCNSYYSYLHPAPTDYSCPTRTKDYYVLRITGAEGMQPVDSKTFTPCVGASTTWNASSSVWVFTSDNIT